MVQRWLYSTNAKDIAVLYFMIALFSGMAGTAMSMIIRLELAAPGSQYLAGNNQLFNVLVVGHAVLMIFFLVMPALIGGFGKINLYNNYYIKYNYNNNNIYYINIINKLINRLNININNLSNILSYYYNKKVKGDHEVGFIAVLHTFGSDLKWNPHIHALFTEGGIDKNNKWFKTLSHIPYQYLRKSWQKLVLDIIKTNFKDRET